MSKEKFKLNRKGVAELMKSEEMQGILTEYASGVKNRCGDGYTQDIYVGKTVRTQWCMQRLIKQSVTTRKNNTILKAVRG